MNGPSTRCEAGCRSIAVPTLLGIAYVHVMDLPDKLEEAPYMAALFIGLIAICVVLAAALLCCGVERGRLAWFAALVIAPATIIGFVLSRTVGLPELADHVGKWDALGLASLILEGVLILLALVALASGPRTPPERGRKTPLSHSNQLAREARVRGGPTG